MLKQLLILMALIALTMAKCEPGWRQFEDKSYLVLFLMGFNGWCIKIYEFTEKKYIFRKDLRIHKNSNKLNLKNTFKNIFKGGQGLNQPSNGTGKLHCQKCQSSLSAQ